MRFKKRYEGLVCPECRTGIKWMEQSGQCTRCRRYYEVKEGIPVFEEKRGYWCNVDQITMNRMIKHALISGNWIEAVSMYIQKYAEAVVHLHRADAQFIFPIDTKARVLDAGSMWGGLTIPIAQFCKEVYAVDKTWETLRFLQIRSEQMKLENIKPVLSGINKMPFSDDYFDFVVLNGVLEWLGFEQDIILEKHWKGKREDRQIYVRDPKKMQEHALGELLRVLKPGGGIYVAIENRIGLQYFLGHPDDHVNIRFVTFFPRFLANYITKIIKNAEYRTYIYSPSKLVELIKGAGFTNVKLYSVYPHYNKISRITPFSIFASLRSFAIVGYAHIKVFALSFVWRLTPKFCTKYISPSLCAIASKGKTFNNLPRLLSLLQSVGVLDTSEISYHELSVVNNRFGNGNPTNYLVFDKSSERIRFFCKISRQQNEKQLIKESEMISYAKRLISSPELASSLPSIRYAGVIEGIPIQVTDFIEGSPIGKGVLDGLRRINNFIDICKFPLPSLINKIKAIARKRWLKIINPYMLEGIELLAKLQHATKVRSIRISTIAEEWVNKKVAVIRDKGMNTADFKHEIESLRCFLSKLNGIEVPVCMVHGDYDLCNILVRENGMSIVDFEHSEKLGLPFFDIGNLIFGPLLMEWKCLQDSISLCDYAEKTRWKEYIEKWLNHYSDISELPLEVLSFLPCMAVLEQNAKDYEYYRNPYDYPMYGENILKEMIGWRLNIFKK